MKKTLEQKYCTGCGLCESMGKGRLERDDNGFSFPVNYDKEWIEKICPCEGHQLKWMDCNSVWGRKQQVYLGWSNNQHVRNMASSGGILTEIAKYLLENKLVDVVIQTKEDKDKPYATVTEFNEEAINVEKYMGSRYAISQPLSIISKLEKNKKYALIGKPCDIISIRNLIENEPEYKNQIVCLLSFFCAGIPSDNAQVELIHKLGTEVDEIESLRYRGDGWPGFTKAVDKQGREYTLTYNEAWGHILGRDIMPACRFCIDGIGESADISCGDAWYLDSEGNPDFDEHEGRNVIFARSEKGNAIIEDLIKKKIISAQIYNNYENELKRSQYAQRERRETIMVKKLAMSFLLKRTPKYRYRYIIKYFYGSSIRLNYHVFKGTIKRALKGIM